MKKPEDRQKNNRGFLIVSVHISPPGLHKFCTNEKYPTEKFKGEHHEFLFQSIQE